MSLTNFLRRQPSRFPAHKCTLWSIPRQHFHSTRRTLSSGFDVKAQHFAPETSLSPYPFMQIERDLRTFGINEEKEFAENISVNEDGTYLLGGTTYNCPMTVPPATIYDPNDHSFYSCPVMETPKVQNLYLSEADSIAGWNAATSSYLRDMRDHDKVNAGDKLFERAYFGGCISPSPRQMYLDSTDPLPLPISFPNDGKPPSSILHLLNLDVIESWDKNSHIAVDSFKSTSTQGNLGYLHGDVGNLAVALKARTLDPEFLDVFDVDHSYRGHEAMWFLHIWMTLRWMRMRPTPYYAQLQEVLFQFLIREAQVSNRRFGIVSLKFSYHNLNLLQQEVLDMFNEFDKALSLSLAGDNHLWYHVLYHHIYRVAESRPVPATITFKPKEATHFPIKITKPVDRAHINNLIQYINDYLYTYAAMPLEYVHGAYNTFMTLPQFPKRVGEKDLLGPITATEMDIFSRYIQHPSPMERGDEYTNQKARSLLVALNTFEPSVAPVDASSNQQKSL